MLRFTSNRVACILLLVTASGLAAQEKSFTDQDFAHFERRIRPLLSRRCYDCHSDKAKKSHGGLRLDTAAALQKGGDSGPAIVAGKPDESLLIQAIRYAGDIQMPPKGKLPLAEIAELERWVKRGAPIPPSANVPERTKGIDYEAGRKFWAFQPLHSQALPQTETQGWARSRLDWFVLAAMEERKLVPSPSADRATLIRRLTFDLTGLPPTPAQVQRFVNDTSPDAYEELVERLLSSPRYGEKWARMWLDMARYTDRTASWLYQTGAAHLYRDWVVKAFNDDMPYDEFVHRQLATDLMPETGPEDVPALGFISLSPTYWKELQLPCDIIKVIVADEWEERVDAVSRTFLGLTVACARCHDHKFDPISSADYYALAGVFASCRQIDRPMISDEAYAPVKQAKEEVAKLEKEIAKLKKMKPVPQPKIKSLQDKVRSIKEKTPLYNTPMANALSEESLYVVPAGKTSQNGTKLEYRSGPRDLPLFKRGNPNRPGPIVKRSFIRVLAANDQPEPFEQGSGRLELAKAITEQAGPLAARVIVNRIWLGHFGRGLVSTPSNFGTQGSRPSHPRLLEDLAYRFVKNNWSIKQLHREILLSATWRQSSQARPAALARDPENKYLWRMNRRRLDFESWRDAMLASSGELELSIGGASTSLDEANNRRRTLYGTIHRRDMSTTLQIHDFPDPTQHSPQRSSTVTALQGLYALNGPLLQNQSQRLAQRVRREHPEETEEQVRRLYWLLYGRSPSSRELKLGIQFLSMDGTDANKAWRQYAHVMLLSNEFQFVD